MIVQDSQTGALHQVPDHLSGYGDYADKMLYDGLGNPVGRLSGFFDDIGKAVGSVVSAIPGVGPALSLLPGAVSSVVSAIPGVGPALSNLLPGGAATPFAPPPVPPLPFTTIPAPAPAYPMAPGLPSFQPPWPAGWVRPPLPYTGLGPSRLYMRCAMWPGPRGLVPAFAQNLPPQAPPGFPPQPWPYMGGGRRHHRRHRR
jgi:hypothetical protein